MNNEKTEVTGRGLNRDVIKYIAMLTMFLNHFAFALLEPGTVLYYIFSNVGYFTAITMCYFLVEGYTYTRSKKKYALRLLIFAVIAQVPFMMTTGFFMLNMLFTLFCCFVTLVVHEKVKNTALRIFLSVLLVLVTAVMDWAFFAVIFTIMFVKWKHNKKKMILAYGIAAFLFGLMNAIGYVFTYQVQTAVMLTAASCLGIIVSGIVILFFYNGKRMEKAGAFSKWFFYAFYPLHLLVLGLIKLFLV